MEPTTEALRLLKRQAEIQHRIRSKAHAPPLRVTEERELYLIRRQLMHFPAAVQAIVLAAAQLHRPIDALSVTDVERCA